MDKEQNEEYYEYVVEQLEFCEMITAVFGLGETIGVTQKTSNKCREFADKIRKNVEHI